MDTGIFVSHTCCRITNPLLGFYCTWLSQFFTTMLASRVVFAIQQKGSVIQTGVACLSQVTLWYSKRWFTLMEKPAPCRFKNIIRNRLKSEFMEYFLRNSLADFLALVCEVAISHPAHCLMKRPCEHKALISLSSLYIDGHVLFPTPEFQRSSISMVFSSHFSWIPNSGKPDGNNVHQ
jgi:hypothetical protein